MRNGKKAVQPAVVAWVHPSPVSSSRPRLGLAVGLRVGNSPTRNRVKRLFREAFRELTKDWAGAPVDIVLLPRPGSAPNDFNEAKTALAGVLKKYQRQRDSRGPTHA